MADGVGSSSVLKNTPDQNVREFDVSNEHDILGLLHFVRRGPFAEGQKHMLRDTILDYATTKNDQTLTTIASHLSSAGAVVTNAGTKVASGADTTHKKPGTSASAQQAEVQQTTIGATRPEPTFKAPHTDTTPSHTQPEDNSSQPEPAADTVRPSSAPSAEPHNSTAAAPEDATSPPETADTDPGLSKSETAPPDTPTDQSPAPEPTAAPNASNTSEEATPKGDDASSHTDSKPTPDAQQSDEPAVNTPAPSPEAHDALSRIKEIKQRINQKVGNPANLIDANNEVGREYMNALLNAMRVASGSNHEETSLAMDRLEKAFAAVHQSIGSGDTVIDNTPQTSSTPAGDDTDIQRPASTPASHAKEPKDRPQSSAPVSASTAAQSSATPAHQHPQSGDAPAQPAQPAEPQSDAQPPQTQPTAAPESAAPESAAPEPAAPQQAAPAQTHVADNEPSAADAQSSEPAHDTNPEQVQSIADRLHQENSERESLLQKRARELEMQQTEESNDPLYSNEVSAGLQQLLSEWKLFKGSGIFGTGPSGYEHPLYTQLSAMPMAAVIAGRFEGVTPEIKQSITDYMNGWRYEQGIVHEMNETFEHYLRRVVKEILEKQQTPQA